MDEFRTCADRLAYQRRLRIEAMEEMASGNLCGDKWLKLLDYWDNFLKAV